ncbi:ribosome-associated toxin RatA of RatAB toxin-antitoxin module [Pseudoduganella lurida]|uniref:Ribosome-associated toxin RatA of RatAB toxin-antitoxin module n=1 Tax=Pseudoduganella lurida TaxID=1036180 RepID=A0A562R1K6_9BURK|nr:SRPBCC family protein [Pseudoduganella lurida]TWI62965.1 ribosome-associated toxin RatA of RatAB toxin-antitoxin module [Pseudoduganella lurida]
MKQLLLFLLIGCTVPALAFAQAPRGDTPKAETPKLQVSVKRVTQDAMHMYEIDATGSVQAPLPTVWRILTGYDRMEEFVPDLASCRVLSRNGNEVIIEQFGTARFLFMSRAVHLIVRATEQPMTSIDIALISGDMKHYESRWELAPIPETGGTRIQYSGRMMPSFYVPGILGTNIIRSDVERMMGAVLVRLDKGIAPRNLPSSSTDLARSQASTAGLPR